MEREEIEALRVSVSCEAVLERAGYQIDLKQSTRLAVKYRRGSEIVIVTHRGQGWFNPLGDEKGDAFRLVMYLERISFSEATRRVADLVGIEPSRPEWKRLPPDVSSASILDRWNERRAPGPGSPVWNYLCNARSVPKNIVRFGIRQGLLREGPFASMWAAHVDTHGTIVGWEERGPDWRGFATGGSKILFGLGSADATRICVTEAAIDAMSLAALEGLRENTRYLSTGGGWSPATDKALFELAARPGIRLVAATDNDSQGEIYAGRLRVVAEAAGCDWGRLCPPVSDWNEALKARTREGGER